MLTFQQIIDKLTHFWAKQGCIIQHGYDIEVGAGTFNPSTFLRCLGSEPFNTVYVEPSRRPQDGRFGENPNRTQLFHQLQVIMKPSPLDIQKIYLQSLAAIEIHLQEHDVRFVHDDWASPTLGAWGLGWEVWLDGMEITQFTYFQSIAGFPLAPISVELTYGLERLCMMVQNKKNCFDIHYNENLSYGDLYHHNEIEWSHYNFYKATTQLWLRHFEDFAHEAQMMAEMNLPIPAYDFVMKASHAFNMLEARGILSVTERTSYIARVRALAKLVASKYLQSLEKRGFPLLNPPLKKPVRKKNFPTPSESFNPCDKEDFLLEIGSEELPPSFVPVGCQNLKNAITTLLKNLSYDSLTIFGTHRRLSLIVKGLVLGKKGATCRHRGPTISIAFDKQGNITKEGKGFLKSLGIETLVTIEKIEQSSVLSIQKIGKRDYLMADVKEEKISTFHLLSHALPQLIANLNFPQKMQWSTIHTSYARPLKWYVALFGSHVIPFELAEITSGKHSWGHAQIDNHPFAINKPSDYVAQCLEHYVMVTIEDRKRSIEEQLSTIERETQTIAIEKKRVLSQVLFLSEWPSLLYGSFDQSFLEAPQELLISEMVQHQKYFPLLSSSNKMLAPLFVITADNIPNSIIKAGNQNVLSARLADGLFLFHQDLKSSLDDFVKQLNTMILQKDLGTIAEKISRIKKFATILSKKLNLGDENTLLRAAELCKADLATELVQEFPNLQGTIGKYYALHQKEKKEVAIAIEEHWLPTYEKGPLPSSASGIILSLADKLDNLISYFHVGLIPTSSTDPYALRRQTLGIIKILIKHKLSIDLSSLIKDPVLLQFIIARTKGVFKEYGFRKDEIEASVQGGCDPYDQHLKIKALHTFRNSTHFTKLLEVYKRAKGQIEKEIQSSLNPNLFTHPSEKNLYHSLSSLHEPFIISLTQKDYQSAFAYLAQLQSPLATLFSEVHILCEEPNIRSNRIALLQKLCSYFTDLVDFGKIQHSPFNSKAQ